MAHCSHEAALRVKGRTKSLVPLHLPHLGPTGTLLAPREQPRATGSPGTACVPLPAPLPGLPGREGRKETHNSFPFRHNCSSPGAKGQLKFSLHRQYPSPCFVSISLPPTGESEQGGGRITVPLPYSRASSLSP